MRNPFDSKDPVIVCDKIYYSNGTPPNISKAYFYSEFTEGLVEKENTLKHNDLKHELRQFIKRKGII